MVNTAKTAMNIFDWIIDSLNHWFIEMDSLNWIKKISISITVHINKQQYLFTLHVYMLKYSKNWVFFK